jgi:hypothetical protein
VQGIIILGMTWSFFFGEMSGKEAALGMLTLIAAGQGLAKILKTRRSQLPSVPESEDRASGPRE